MNELKPQMLKREDYKAIKHMNREDMRPPDSHKARQSEQFSCHSAQ